MLLSGWAGHMLARPSLLASHRHLPRLRGKSASFQRTSRDQSWRPAGALSLGCHGAVWSSRIVPVSASHLVGRDWSRQYKGARVSGPSCRNLSSGPPEEAAAAVTLASRLVESTPASMQPYLKLVRLDKPVGR
jgi:hypothetical protein